MRRKADAAFFMNKRPLMPAGRPKDARPQSTKIPSELSVSLQPTVRKHLIPAIWRADCVNARGETRTFVLVRVSENPKAASALSSVIRRPLFQICKEAVGHHPFR